MAEERRAVEDDDDDDDSRGKQRGGGALALAPGAGGPPSMAPHSPGPRAGPGRAARPRLRASPVEIGALENSGGVVATPVITFSMTRTNNEISH